MTEAWITVDEEAAILHRCAFVERRLMEIQAAWLVTTTRLEHKLTMGRIMYEDALHADLWQRRLPELRMARSTASGPVAELEPFMNEVAHLGDEPLRFAALYTVIKPALLETYQGLTEATDPIGDAPSHRGFKTNMAEESEHIQWGRETLAILNGTATLPPDQTQWADALRAQLNALGGVSGRQPRGSVSFDNPQPPPGPEPALSVRDSRFEVVPWQTMGRGYLPAVKDQATVLRLLNQLVSSETDAMELLGLLVAGHPGWPWAMRFDLIRQAWDEARHAWLAIRRLEELGGSIGMYPVERWLYEFVVFRADPLEQLIALQRVTEGYALDLHRARVDSLLQAEDPRSALMFDYIAADETLHVAIGNWISKLSADSPEQQAYLLERQKDLEAEFIASIAWREDWAEEVFE